MIEIFVDADGCPVKDETYVVATRYGVPVALVANSRMHVPEGFGVELILVEAGPDAADDWIAANVRAGDVVVTGDLPLAARCLAAGALVLGSNGREFSADSIGDLLATRELKSHLRGAGVMTGGPPPLSAKDRSRFQSKLDELVQRGLRAGALARRLAPEERLARRDLARGGPARERRAGEPQPGAHDDGARREVERPPEPDALLEQPRAREQPAPVVHVAADQRQRLRLRVAEVDGDVHQALAEPEHADGRLEALPAPREAERQHGREEELAERAAQEVERLAGDAEEQVAGLVEGEVHAVEEVVLVGEDEPHRVGREKDRQRALPDHAALIGRTPRLS